MKTNHVIQRSILPALAVGVTLLWATPGRADTLTINNMPAGNAVAQLSRRFGVTIVFRSPVNANLPVSFSVDDADTPAGRLQAVSDLADALGLDFQKVYVVSKVDSGASAPDVKVDSNDYVVFPQTKVSAQEAIQTVTAVDGAIAQISGAVTGDVILPSRRMSVTAAAATIAKQTGTEWKVYYGMFRRGEGPARLNGTVLDRTTLGQPITELPLLTFRSTISTPAPITTADMTPPAGLPSFGNPGVPDVSTVPNTSAVTYPDFGAFGGSPYGDNSYSYGSPYGYMNPYANPYAYIAPNGNFAAPGYVYTPGMGAAPAVPGYNAPTGTVPPGVGVTTVPNTGTNIAP